MTQKKALIVDENHLICWALEKEFTSFGLSTRIINNKTEALSELRRQFYNIVFLDVHLTDGGGWTLLREVERVSPETTIIMAGDAKELDRESAFAGGTLQFLEKPFDLSEIHRILKSALGEYPNKRKHPRHTCRIPLRISIVEPTPEEAEYDLNNLSGLVAEVGSGGLRVHAGYPLQVGQHVRARTIPENEQFRKFVLPEFLAEVVWVVEAESGICAGLKFVN